MTRVGIDARLAHATGIGRYVRGLVNALLEHERDLEVVVIANPHGNDPTAVWDWLDAPAGTAKDEGRLEIAQFEKPVAPRSVAEQAWIAEACRRKKLDLLHVPDWNVPFLAPVPVVATIHDATYLRFPEAAPSRLASLGAGIFMRRAAKKARRVIVSTRAAAEEVSSYVRVPREKITVIPLFVDEVASWVARIRLGSCETVSPRVRELPRFVLYVGTHLAHKDVPLLIAAFERVKKELGLRDLVLALAGKEGRNTDACKTGSPSVIFLGEVNDRDLAYLYDRAAVFATASRNEGFGLASLEALAAGTPVIASDIPVHREVLGDAALFVPPRDEKAFAGALARVLTIDALAKDLRRRGPERAANFSARETARATAAVYREVADSKVTA
ncbi:MAG TPA: glycosyltransferase family 1 protein [Planctomycetota bacterium]|nr:glycosyltransferase family 1 protein [Planctomycetota bacterium]